MEHSGVFGSEVGFHFVFEGKKAAEQGPTT